MKMPELQRRLVRAVSDLDAIGQELWERGFESDWRTIENAITETGKVCIGFLEGNVLDELPLSDIIRPAPGEANAA